MKYLIVETDDLKLRKKDPPSWGNLNHDKFFQRIMELLIIEIPIFKNASPVFSKLLRPALALAAISVAGRNPSDKEFYKKGVRISSILTFVITSDFSDLNLSQDDKKIISEIELYLSMVRDKKIS